MTIFRQPIQRLWRWWKSGGTQPPGKSPRRLQMEVLEDRTVPALVFAPQYGVQPTTVGSNVLQGDVPVYLIFAGGSSSGFGYDGSVNQSAIVNAVNNILSSSYLSGLAEYGAATRAHLAGTCVSSFSLPTTFTDNGNNSDINNLVSASIKNNGGSLPEPDDTGPNGIYLVITPPGYHLANDVNGALVGHHSNGNTGSFFDFFDPDNAYDGVVTSNSYYTGNALDDMTVVLSHELVNMLTDPNGSGGVVTAPGSGLFFPTEFGPPVFSGSANPGEIGDNEAEFYSGFENGTAVQSYWSNSQSAYIVPGATQHRFTLSNQHLTVQGAPYGLKSLGGDLFQLQLGTTAVDTSASGGVMVTVNGETVTFAPNTVTSIDVQSSWVGDNVDIEHTLAGVPVTIDSTSSDTVRISPSGRFLDNIQGSVKINGNGSDTLIVNDQNDNFSDTYTLTSSSITRPFFAGITYSGVSAVTVNGGSGAETYNVKSTGAPLMLNTGSGNDTVFLGSGNMNSLAGAVTVTGQGGSDTLTFDNSQEAQGKIYDLNQAASSSATGVLQISSLSGVPQAPLTYSYIKTVNINAGPGNDVINIHRTTDLSSTFVNTGAGNDSVTVGDHGLIYWVWPLTVTGQGGNDTITFDNSQEAQGKIYDLSTSASTGVGTMQISTLGYVPQAPLSYRNVQVVNLDAGPGNDIVDVNNTAAGVSVTVNTGAGTDTVNVSPAGILGALTVNGQGGTSTLNLNDQFNTTGLLYTLTAPTVARPGAAPITYSGLTNLVINAGSGNDAVNARSLVAGTHLTFNGGAGSNTLLAPNFTNTWTISGSNTGNLAAGNLNGGPPITFNQVQNLTGSLSANTFKFLSGGSVSGVIDGLAGLETLDYSAWSSPVTVNLTTGQASGVGGGILNIQNVIGGAGNTLLVGNALANTLTATGSGYSILIGHGAQQLKNNGTGSALMIGGRTAFDNNATALLALLSEWDRTDETLTQKMAHLTGTPGGRNGTTFLIASGANQTVFGDPTAKVTFLDSDPGSPDWIWYLLGHDDISGAHRTGDLFTREW
jgi:hypothetical protein